MTTNDRHRSRFLESAIAFARETSTPERVRRSELTLSEARQVMRLLAELRAVLPTYCMK